MGKPIITQEIIEGYAKAGYSSLRIPVSWGNLLSDDFKVHPDLMDRVEKILNWTLDCGMVAIINIHHENEWIKQVPTDSKAKEKFTSNLETDMMNAYEKLTVTTYCSSQ